MIENQQIFFALGNDRPAILVQLEDCVLKAVIAISEGKARENVMDKLYSDISVLEKDLIKDEKALAWFDLLNDDSFAPSTPMPPAFTSTPFTGTSV